MLPSGGTEVLVMSVYKYSFIHTIFRRHRSVIKLINVFLSNSFSITQMAWYM